MTLPLLGLVAGFDSADAIVPLVVALRPWCRPHALDTSLGAPDAYLVASPFAPGIDRALRAAAPTAVVVNSLELIPDNVVEHADVLVARDRAVADALGSRAIVFARDWVRAADHPPISPFVRARWRERLGIADRFFVRLGVQDAWTGPDATIPAALAVCTAAAVRGPALLTALALGTPVVTDDDSARRVGAEPGVHVLTATPTAVDVALEELAANPARATAIGIGGRHLVETRHDLGALAIDLLDRLGIGPAPFPDAPLASLDAELAALGTPDASPVVIRALRRASRIAGPADWADLTGRRR